MKTCPKCGHTYDDDIDFCPNCETNSSFAHAPEHHNGGMMVWSVFTLFMCLIPGIFAISQTRKANAAMIKTDEDAALRRARIWNIVGCTIGVLMIYGTVLEILAR